MATICVGSRILALVSPRFSANQKLDVFELAAWVPPRRALPVAARQRSSVTNERREIIMAREAGRISRRSGGGGFDSCEYRPAEATVQRSCSPIATGAAVRLG